MMKVYIVLLIFAGVFFSCQKDLDLYSGVDFVYFDATQDSTYFSYAYVDGTKDRDTVQLWLRMSGNVTDYDRKVKLVVAESDGEAGVDYEALPEYYTLSGKYTFCVAPVVLLRPAILQKEERYLILELQESPDFKIMMPEASVNKNSAKKYSKIRHKIVFSEIMTAPKAWDIAQFGAFSVKKLTFMCEKLNMTREMFTDVSYINTRKKYMATKIKKILDDLAKGGNTVYEEDNKTPMRMGDMYYK